MPAATKYTVFVQLRLAFLLELCLASEEREQVDTSVGGDEND